MRTDYHETLVEHEAIEGPSNRSFGLTVGGILVAIALVRSLLKLDLDLISIVMLVVGGTLLALAAVSPKSLSGANRLWMRLGALLAAIMTPLVLLLVYALTFIPIGLIMRLRGHDPLRSKRAIPGGSYWIRRPSPDTMVSSMSKQF